MIKKIVLLFGVVMFGVYGWTNIINKTTDEDVLNVVNTYVSLVEDKKYEESFTLLSDEYNLISKDEYIDFKKTRDQFREIKNMEVFLDGNILNISKEGKDFFGDSFQIEYVIAHTSNEWTGEIKLVHGSFYEEDKVLNQMFTDKINLSLVLSEDDQNSEAKNQLEKTKKIGPFPDPFYYKSLILFNDDKTDESIDELSAFVEIHETVSVISMGDEETDQAYQMLMELLLSEERDSEAKEVFKQYRNVSENYQSILRYQEMLD